MTRARSLALMSRLERQELDHRRRMLSGQDARIAAIEHELGACRSGFAQELATGWQLPDGPRLLAAWSTGARRRETELQRERDRLQAEREQLVEAVREQHITVKRFELLAERAVAAELSEIRRREQTALDELAVLRHRRHET